MYDIKFLQWIDYKFEKINIVAKNLTESRKYELCNDILAKLTTLILEDKFVETSN
jgi:hypothetical protein